jgi:hypothetical protein
MDPLVYSEIQNNIINQELLQDLATNTNITSGNINTIQNKLNDYLDETTIKRACCMGRAGPNKGDGSTGIKVKIPIPQNYNLLQDLDANLEKQFQYIEKTVYIPQTLCDASWVKYDPYCDNFMNIYCTNQLQTFKNLNGGTFDEGKWKVYAKECSCYAPVNPSYASAPRTCYMNGCSLGDTGVYIDPSSRGQQCDMTVCTSILNAEGIKAGGSANINSQVQQNCGSVLPKKPVTQNTSSSNPTTPISTIASSNPNIQSTPNTTQPSTNNTSNTSNTTQPSTTNEILSEYVKNNLHIIIIIIIVIIFIILCCFILLYIR